MDPPGARVVMSAARSAPGTSGSPSRVDETAVPTIHRFPARVRAGEEVVRPDVGEAAAGGGRAGPLLERVPSADRVRLVLRRLAERPEEVDEVLLGGGLLPFPR